MKSQTKGKVKLIPWELSNRYWSMRKHQVTRMKINNTCKEKSTMWLGELSNKMLETQWQQILPDFF